MAKGVQFEASRILASVSQLCGPSGRGISIVKNEYKLNDEKKNFIFRKFIKYHFIL